MCATIPNVAMAKDFLTYMAKGVIEVRCISCARRRPDRRPPMLGYVQRTRWGCPADECRVADCPEHGWTFYVVDRIDQFSLIAEHIEQQQLRELPVREVMLQNGSVMTVPDGRPRDIADDGTVVVDHSEVAAARAATRGQRRATRRAADTAGRGVQLQCRGCKAKPRLRYATLFGRAGAAIEGGVDHILV